MASCASGRMAIRLPPALTQLLSIVTWAAVSGHLAQDGDVVGGERGRRQAGDVNRGKLVQTLGLENLLVVAAERIAVAFDQQDGAAGSSGRVEDHVHPVVGRARAQARESACGPIGIGAIGSIDAFRQRVQRSVVNASCRKVVRVVAVMAHIRVVRDDVGGVGNHRDGRRKIHLLPS